MRRRIESGSVGAEGSAVSRKRQAQLHLLSFMTALGTSSLPICPPHPPHVHTHTLSAFSLAVPHSFPRPPWPSAVRDRLKRDRDAHHAVTKHYSHSGPVPRGQVFSSTLALARRF